MAESWITNRPVGAAAGDFFRRLLAPPGGAPGYPQNAPGAVSTSTPSLYQVMRSPDVVYSMPAPRRAAGNNPMPDFNQQDTAGRAMEPWALAGYQPSDTKARNTAAQSSKRGAGQLPTVSYAGIPAGGLTIDQALKFLSVTKPRSPGEQAQQMLLDRAQSAATGIPASLAKFTLPKQQAEHDEAARKADQDLVARLLLVSGGNLFNQGLGLGLPVFNPYGAGR